MYVDSADALAGDDDFAPARLRMGMGKEGAADERNRPEREHIAAAGHERYYLNRRKRRAAQAKEPRTSATPRSIQPRVANASRGCGTGGPDDIQKWNAAMASQASAPRMRSAARPRKASSRLFTPRA